MKYKLIQ